MLSDARASRSDSKPIANGRESLKTLEATLGIEPRYRALQALA
jgi:hypothetical protein